MVWRRGDGVVRELPRLQSLREGDVLTNGAALRPVPPGSGKDEDSRWVGVYEGELDGGQVGEWVRQAAAIPGWDGF